MLLFLTSIILYLLFSSFFICGFYKISRHRLVIMPDEKIKSEGDILKWWSEFWEQTNGVIQYQYQGSQLEEKFKVLKAANSQLAAKLKLAPEKMSLTGTVMQDERNFISEYLQVTVFINADNVFLFLDEPKYRFPKSVRFLTSQCHVCMSSPLSGGGLLWLLFCNVSRGMFDWAANPALMPWLFWIPFCIALSFLNYLVGRKAEL